MGIFSIDSRALAAPNLKDLHRNACVLAGNVPWRGTSPSPCNGLFALEGLSFSTGVPVDLVRE